MKLTKQMKQAALAAVVCFSCDSSAMAMQEDVVTTPSARGITSLSQLQELPDVSQELYAEINRINNLRDSLEVQLFGYAGGAEPRSIEVLRERIDADIPKARLICDMFRIPSMETAPGMHTPLSDRLAFVHANLNILRSIAQGQLSDEDKKTAVLAIVQQMLQPSMP